MIRTHVAEATDLQSAPVVHFGTHLDWVLKLYKRTQTLEVFGAFFALAHLLDIHYNKIDVFRGTKEERMKM